VEAGVGWMTVSVGDGSDCGDGERLGDAGGGTHFGE
jgi:hypothetical protein